jgi:hypothetical protein
MKLWIAFWVLFLGAPIVSTFASDGLALAQKLAGVFSLSVPDSYSTQIGLGVCLTGVIGAAFCAACIYERTIGWRLLRTTYIAFALCCCYVPLAFFFLMMYGMCP